MAIIFVVLLLYSYALVLIQEALIPKITSMLKKLVPFSQQIYKSVNEFLLEVFINFQKG